MNNLALIIKFFEKRKSKNTQGTKSTILGIESPN
jgi:hypothetical protein